MHSVGLIGLGLMGTALAERFRGGGLRVVGHDLRDEPLRRLAALGGEPRSSARDVVEAVPLVVLSLPSSDVVAAVMNEVWDLLPGRRIVDTTTGDPDATAELGRRLAGHGADYLDATLTGSSRQAREGAVVVTAGGPAEVFRSCEELFRLFAARCFHVGPWGSGARTKLVVNLVLGLQRAVLAEGLAFARSCGLDPAAVLDVLRGGAAHARVMDSKGAKMLAGDFTPEAKLAQHLKDVRLILDQGLRTGAKLPLSEVHERLLAALVERGLGEWDNSAVIRAFDAVEEP